MGPVSAVYEQNRSCLTADMLSNDAVCPTSGAAELGLLNEDRDFEVLVVRSFASCIYF